MSTLQAIGFTLCGGGVVMIGSLLAFGYAVSKRAAFGIAPRCTARHPNVVYNPEVVERRQKREDKKRIADHERKRQKWKREKKKLQKLKERHKSKAGAGTAAARVVHKNEQTERQKENLQKHERRNTEGTDIVGANTGDSSGGSSSQGSGDNFNGATESDLIRQVRLFRTSDDGSHPSQSGGVETSFHDEPRRTNSFLNWSGRASVEARKKKEQSGDEELAITPLPEAVQEDDDEDEAHVFSEDETEEGREDPYACQDRGNPIWGWIPWSLGLSYETMLKGIPGTGTRKQGLEGALLRVNLDAIVLFRFHAICLRVAFATMCLCVFIVLPINLTARCYNVSDDVTSPYYDPRCFSEEYALSNYERTTLRNVPALDVTVSERVWGRTYRALSWRLYGIVFCSWFVSFLTVHLVDQEWVDALALRRVYYLEGDHWKMRKEELAETLLKMDEEDEEAGGSGRSTRRLMLHPDDDDSDYQEDDLPTSVRQRRAINRGYQNPKKRRDPWIPHPEQRDTVPNIELYSVLVGGLPALPSEVVDQEDDEEPVGFSRRQSIDWQLAVATTFFDHCVPNQPGFSSSVVAVTILPDAPELARAWRKWYVAASALRRLRFIRTLIADMRRYDPEDINDDDDEEEKREDSEVVFSANNLTNDNSNSTSGRSSIYNKNDRSHGDKKRAKFYSGEMMQHQKSRKRLSEPSTPVQNRKNRKATPNSSDSSIRGGGGVFAGVSLTSLGLSNRDLGSTTSSGKRRTMLDLKEDFRKSQPIYLDDNRRMKYYREVFGTAEDEDVEAHLFQALNYGPEQSAVYTREFAQSAAPCCPNGCGEERLRRTGIDELLILESDAIAAVHEANMALHYAQARAAVSVLDTEDPSMHLPRKGHKEDIEKDLEEDLNFIAKSSHVGLDAPSSSKNLSSLPATPITSNSLVAARPDSGPVLPSMGPMNLELKLSATEAKPTKLRTSSSEPQTAPSASLTRHSQSRSSSSEDILGSGASSAHKRSKSHQTTSSFDHTMLPEDLQVEAQLLNKSVNVLNASPLKPSFTKTLTSSGTNATSNSGSATSSTMSSSKGGTSNTEPRRGSGQHSKSNNVSSTSASIRSPSNPRLNQLSSSGDNNGSRAEFTKKEWQQHNAHISESAKKPRPHQKKPQLQQKAQQQKQQPVGGRSGNNKSIPQPQLPPLSDATSAELFPTIAEGLTSIGADGPTSIMADARIPSFSGDRLRNNSSNNNNLRSSLSSEKTMKIGNRGRPLPSSLRDKQPVNANPSLKQTTFKNIDDVPPPPPPADGMGESPSHMPHKSLRMIMEDKSRRYSSRSSLTQGSTAQQVPLRPVLSNKSNMTTSSAKPEQILFAKNRPLWKDASQLTLASAANTNTKTNTINRNNISMTNQVITKNPPQDVDTGAKVSNAGGPGRRRKNVVIVHDPRDDEISLSSNNTAGSIQTKHFNMTADGKFHLSMSTIDTSSDIGLDYNAGVSAYGGGIAAGNRRRTTVGARQNPYGMARRSSAFAPITFDDNESVASSQQSEQQPLPPSFVSPQHHMRRRSSMPVQPQQNRPPQQHRHPQMHSLSTLDGTQPLQDTASGVGMPAMPARRRVDTETSAQWSQVERIVQDNTNIRGNDMNKTAAKKKSRKPQTGVWETPQIIPHINAKALWQAGANKAIQFTKWATTKTADVVEEVASDSTFAVVTFTSRQAAVAARHCLADGRGANRWLTLQDIPVPPLADAAACDLQTCRGCCRPVSLNINRKQQMVRKYVSVMLLLGVYIFGTPLLATAAALVDPTQLYQIWPSLEARAESSVFFSQMLSGIMPALIFTAFFALCPVLFKGIANFGSNATSVHSAEYSALQYYWYFMVVTAFSGSSLMTMVLNAINQGRLSNSAADVLIEIAGTLPGPVAATWINWIIVRTTMTLPLQYLLQINTFVFKYLGWNCCARCVAGGGPGGPIPYRIFIDSGVVFLCTAVLGPVSPILAPFAFFYFLFCTPLWRRNCIFMYRPKYDGGGIRWPFLSDIFIVSLVVSQILLSTMMVMKEAIGPAIIAALPIFPTLIFRHMSRNRYLKAYNDAGLLQTSLLDGWDNSVPTAPEKREEYRQFLVDAHKAAYIPICIAGGATSVLTAEPAVVVPHMNDAPTTTKTNATTIDPVGAQMMSSVGSITSGGASVVSAGGVSLPSITTKDIFRDDASPSLSTTNFSSRRPSQHLASLRRLQSVRGDFFASGVFTAFSIDEDDDESSDDETLSADFQSLSDRSPTSERKRPGEL